MQNSVGVNFFSKEIKIWGKIIKLHIHDTAGTERFKSFIPQKLKNSQAVVLVYDVTEEFESIQYWEDLIDKNSKANTIIYIVGNKVDQPSFGKTKRRNLEIIEKTKENWGNRVKFIEVSAKTGQNIN